MHHLRSYKSAVTTHKAFKIDPCSHGLRTYDDQIKNSLQPKTIFLSWHILRKFVRNKPQRITNHRSQITIARKTLIIRAQNSNTNISFRSQIAAIILELVYSERRNLFIQVFTFYDLSFIYAQVLNKYEFKSKNFVYV